MKLSQFLDAIANLRSEGSVSDPEIEFFLGGEKVILLDGVWKEFQNTDTGELRGCLTVNLAKQPKSFNDLLGILLQKVSTEAKCGSLREDDPELPDDIPKPTSLHEILAASLLGLGTPSDSCDGCGNDPAPPRSILDALTPDQYEAVEEAKRASQLGRL
jgi:hypothetical protein